MASVTIELEDEVLERARARANDEKTSVDTLVRSYLETYAGPGKSYEQVTKEILELARRSKSGSGGRRWTRDELYER